jgi:hypothetical protein
MSDRLEAIRCMREKVGREVPVMGWVEGALAEAADLRGVSTLLSDLYDRPDWVEDLLEKCVDVEIAFARAQVEAGAESSVWDWPVQVAPKMYRQFGCLRAAHLHAVHEMGGSGACTSAEIPIASWPTWLRAAQTSSISIDGRYGEAAAFWGWASGLRNFDPVAVMLQAHRSGAAGRLEMYGNGWVQYQRCRLRDPDGTLPANLQAQAQALQSHNQGKKSLHSKV